MSQVCCWARTWQKQGRIQFRRAQLWQFPRFFPSTTNPAGHGVKSRSMAAPRTQGIAQGIAYSIAYRVAAGGSGGAGCGQGRRTGRAAYVVPGPLARWRSDALLVGLRVWLLGLVGGKRQRAGIMAAGELDQRVD